MEHAVLQVPAAFWLGGAEEALELVEEEKLLKDYDWCLRHHAVDAIPLSASS